MMDEFAPDLRVAVRTLWKARGFTALAVFTLALGMALNAAVFAVVNAYLLKSLPYPGATRLYNVVYSRPGQSQPRGLATLGWDTLAGVIEHPIAWDLDMFYLIGGDRPEAAPGTWVTPGFMQGLGIHPALGRAFSPDEFRPGSPQAALISHSLWRNRFGGDPAILGRRFEAYVSDRPQEAEVFTVVGVLPADFWHFNPYTQILAPLRVPTYPYLVRLRAGVPPAEAERRISTLVQREVQLQSSHGVYVARVRPILLTIAAAAGLVLLIACANVAFLLLIRATRRRKEIAVRLALGAGRGRIARMLIVEALLLGTAAMAAGLSLSWLLLAWLAPLVQRQLGRSAPGGVSAIAVDGAVLAAAGACCLVTAVVFALAPLLASWRTPLSRAMHHGSRSGTEGTGSRRTRSALIALEVAASLTLLAGCGLMIQTVRRLLHVDFGLRAAPVLSAQLGLRQRSYPDPPTRLAFYERLLPRLAGMPGVQAAGLANWWALQPPRPQPVEAEGSGRMTAGVLAVSPDYFAALGVPLLQGRAFTAADRAGADPVALASETLARRLWPAGGALGRQILVPGPPPLWRTVIGVVKDVRQSPTDEDLADLYIPLLQAPGRFASLYLRTAGPPASWLPALRQAVQEVDPELALDTSRPLQEFVDEQLARPRFLASLLAGFALFAALLALLGVYGVIAYAVKQREHEIAVRMALGADTRAVTRLFVRQGALVLGIGIIAGLYGATALGRSLETQLYGVRPGDPATLVAASLAFAAAGLAAVWWPARRAAHTDPAVALREE